MNEQNGGNLIGLGSFGCVFHPAIKCSGQKNIHGDMVSKVFFSEESKKEAEEEIKIDKLVKSIKGYEQWSHIWEKNCLPKKYEELIKEDKDIKRCLLENGVEIDEFNKYRRMLQGIYAGKDLSSVFNGLFNNATFSNKAKFTNNFLHIIKLMKPLFIGLISMNKGKISHNDIKPDNIMVDKEGCKFIDFGLAAKHSNDKFYKQRSMSEFLSDRIYPSYPYEFIYMYATKEVIEDEKTDKEYDIYRDLYDRYQLVHETIFQRKKLKEYLLELIDHHLKNNLQKDKNEIISKLDTYSVGVLLPGMLARAAKKCEKLNKLKSYCNLDNVKPFIELFKDMSDPDHHERIPPTEAYRRYNELEILYLTKTKTSKKSAKKSVKKTRRVRKA